MFLFKVIKYQLYLLQLENYELGRYFTLLFKKGLRPKGLQRKDLVWSKKVKALLTVAVGLHILIVVLAVKIFSLWFLLLIIIFLPFYFLLFTLALLLLWPADFIAKQIIIYCAKSKIKKLSINLDYGTGAGMTQRGLKIIGIAGSYGKTTMKEVLGAVLSAKFLVLSTPESVNTPVGIARWILQEFPSPPSNSLTPRPLSRGGEGESKIEIALVEMGEHYKGDIIDICDIARPDIAVVTGINESHLERMKSMDIVVGTIFEIAGGAKPDAAIVLNADDSLVMRNYQKFARPDTRVAQYTVSSIKSKVFNIEALEWEAEFDGIGKVNINLLGEYALGDVDAAVKVAKNLGMADEEIKHGISRIKPVEHRLQPIESNGILVIDDSYNGNPEGAAEAIKVLSRFASRRKIYITPGLVEMGKAAPEVHREIGRQLAGAADVVILIKNSVTPFIEEGVFSVSSSGLPQAKPGDPVLDSRLRGNDKMRNRNGKPEIIWFNGAQEAHAGLKNILKPGDVILFQNDWGDQYV